MEIQQNQEMNYSMLLMNHLNKISFISTSNFIEAVNSDSKEKYYNAKTIGDKALEWGRKYLYCITPKDLRDKEFLEEQKAFDKIKGGATDFEMIYSVVNLLHRKGLLNPNKLSGRKGQQPNEVFE